MSHLLPSVLGRPIGSTQFDDTLLTTNSDEATTMATSFEDNLKNGFQAEAQAEAEANDDDDVTGSSKFAESTTPRTFYSQNNSDEDGESGSGIYIGSGVGTFSGFVIFLVIIWCCCCN